MAEGLGSSFLLPVEYRTRVRVVSWRSLLCPLPVLVQFTNPTEQEANTSVLHRGKASGLITMAVSHLVTNHTDQLPPG